MQQVLSFVKSKPFVAQLLLAVFMVFVIFFSTYKWLSSTTNHGQTVTVPDLKGMKMKDIESFLSQKSLSVKISDSSVFVLDKQPGTVIEQDPAPNEKVKEGRTIYITITRTVPPQVKIPNLVDVSQRQAEAILGSYGLKVGQLIYKPDLAKDAVLAMTHHGVTVNPGDQLPKGSVIDLILGDGIGNTSVSIPALLNLTLDEALFVLQGSQLNAGSMIFDETVKDSTRAKIYKQSPAPGDSTAIKQGESVDLFFTQSETKLKSAGSK
jgi:beta-lactam-binding protein with PASTA domain